jgi:uncharacterized repeat protein (TIGR01451 family)
MPAPLGSETKPSPAADSATPSQLPPIPGLPLVPDAVKPTTPAAQSVTQLKPVQATEEAKPAELNPELPAGRQDSAISMEWVAPAVAKIGVAQGYVLALRNAGTTPVQEVLVRVSIPAGMRMDSSEPKGDVENNVHVWRVGTMMPHQDKNLQMKLVADARGDVTPKAWVTFTGMTLLRVKVREPKLVAQVAAPEKVMIGDPAAFTLTVSNPGDGQADQVKIHAKISDGLEHGRGSEVNFDIGNLAAGESRSVQMICGTRAGGVQKCACLAEAEGGLAAGNTVSVNVVSPRLDLQVVGPGLRYLDRKALYTLRVMNQGDAAATNVTVADVVPAGFKVLAATDGGRHDSNTRTVSWFLGEIGPGQAREVKFEAQAIEIGEQKHQVSAVGARGLRTESEMVTRVEGVSAMALDLTNAEDLIEVGAETTYEVRVANTGSKTETDIKLVAVLPDKMEFKNVVSPVPHHVEGKSIIFDPIDKLMPRAEATVKITVKALEAGSIRFKAQVSSANLVEPVLKMEPTRIYSDAAEGKSPQK